MADFVEVSDADAPPRLHGVPVRKYRSRRTGMAVCVAQAPGPLLHCYLVLPTGPLPPPP